VLNNNNKKSRMRACPRDIGTKFKEHLRPPRGPEWNILNNKINHLLSDYNPKCNINKHEPTVTKERKSININK